MSAAYAKYLTDLQGTVLENVVRHYEQLDESSPKRKELSAKLSAIYRGVVQVIAPSLIIEVGAHDGRFSKLMKKLMPQSRVIAIEANPVVFEKYAPTWLEAGIEAQQVAVAAESGSVTFSVPVRANKTEALTMGSLLLDRRAADHRQFTVKAEPLDNLVDPSLTSAMWVDVEGAIGSMLDGAEKVLANCQAFYVEVETTERWPGQLLDHEVIARLMEFGLVPVARDVQRQVWQYNVMFLKQDLIANPSIKAKFAQYGRFNEGP